MNWLNDDHDELRDSTEGWNWSDVTDICIAAAQVLDAAYRTGALKHLMAAVERPGSDVDVSALYDSLHVLRRHSIFPVS